MKQQPFVSVIVPSYNIEDYIAECIESIIEQSYSDWELILVDDGSKDHTGEICDEYAKKNERIRVIHKENGGLVSARKCGLKEAAGEYIFYVDGDDWITPDALEIVCECAQREAADIVIADYIQVQGDEKKNISQNIGGGLYTKEDLHKEFYPQMLCTGEYYVFGIYPSLDVKIIRRSLLLKNQNKVDNRIRLGEDAACSYGCYLDAERIFYLKEKYIHYYRLRQTSISHSILRTLYTEEIEILINHLRSRFWEYSKKIDVSSVLEPQLRMYTCYMVDNMLTAYIGFWNLFFGKELKETLAYIRDSEMGQKMLQQCKLVRTSSRTKRLLKVIENPCLTTKIEFLLFRMYEKCRR